MKYRQKQAAILLCGTLLIFELKGIKRPSRKRILSFLRSGHVNLETTGDDIWKDEDGVWKQLFSWCREDKTRDGLLAYIPYQDRGIWRLSENGRQRMQKFGRAMVERGFTPESYTAQVERDFGGCLMTSKFVGNLFEACGAAMS